MTAVGADRVAAAPASPASPTVVPEALAISPGATFVPMNPTRIADTRRAFGSSIAGKIPAGATTTIKITGRADAPIPADATAVVLNVTVDNTSGWGFATVYPSGIGQPDASNLNYNAAGYTGANLVTVKIGAGGSVNAYTYAAAHLIVDVFGYYVPAAGAVSSGRVESVLPDRLYDSRSGSPMSPGEYRLVTLPRVPAGATGVILNYTVAGASKGGYFSILPPGQRPATGEPATSNVNVTQTGATVANQAILPIGSNQQVLLFTTAGGHVILDLFGYITGPSAPITTRGLFVPLPAPFRMLDTRSSANNPLGPTLRMWQGWIADINVLGRGGVPTTGVGAVVGNTTFVDSHGPGWLAVYPGRTVFPGTSTVNTYYGGQIAPNHTTSPITTNAGTSPATGGVSIRAGDTGGHVLFDVSGYYVNPGSPVLATLPATTNIPPPPTFPLKLSIPSLGHESWIQGDTSDASLSRGPGWWPGSAYPGVGGNFVVFGHRTESGGPFRYINSLGPGDIIVVEGDHRKVTYRIDDPWFVIHASDAPSYVGPSGPHKISLIACTLPNGSPTSTAYRLIATATLIGYVNT